LVGANSRERPIPREDKSRFLTESGRFVGEDLKGLRKVTKGVLNRYGTNRHSDKTLEGTPISEEEVFGAATRL
jgi:pyruvate/2-oxoglutarate/acetoin dehydrogenase E1 component